MADFAITLPLWASKKNATTIRRTRSGRLWVAKGDAVSRDEASIRGRILEHLSALPDWRRSRTLFGDHEIGVELLWRVGHGLVDVTVRDIGPVPSGKTGRYRDLGNVPCLVLDAMQGLVYDDDRQVCALSAIRN